MKSKLTFRTFTLAIIAGAFGLALTLSPFQGVEALYVLAFAVEAIRIGLIVVNVQIRKENPEQYRLILWLVVIITALNGAVIWGHIPPGENLARFASAQMVNLCLIIGEYAMAVLISGPTPDIVENARLRRELERLEDIERQADKSKQDLSKALATLANHKANRDAIEFMATSNVVVNGIRQAVCECGRISKNKDNSRRETQCACGRDFSYGVSNSPETFLSSK